MVSGTNQLEHWRRYEQSFHFCRNASVSGWATWRRAWQSYDGEMHAWANSEVRKDLRELLGKAEYRVRAEQFERVAAGPVDVAAELDRLWDSEVPEIEWHQIVPPEIQQAIHRSIMAGATGFWIAVAGWVSAVWRERPGTEPAPEPDEAPLRQRSLT
jgi:hypothetical protein